MAQDLLANEGEVATGDVETRAGAWVLLAVVGLCVAFWGAVIGAIVVLV